MESEADVVEIKERGKKSRKRKRQKIKIEKNLGENGNQDLEKINENNPNKKMKKERSPSQVTKNGGNKSKKKKSKRVGARMSTGQGRRQAAAQGQETLESNVTPSHGEHQNDNNATTSRSSQRVVRRHLQKNKKTGRVYWTIYEKRQLLQALQKYGPHQHISVLARHIPSRTPEQVEAYVNQMKNPDYAKGCARKVQNLQMSAPIQHWLREAEDLVRYKMDYSGLLCDILKIAGHYEPKMPIKAGKKYRPNYSSIYTYLANLSQARAPAYINLRAIDAAVVVDLIETLGDELRTYDLTEQRNLLREKYRLLNIKQDKGRKDTPDFVAKALQEDVLESKNKPVAPTDQRPELQVNHSTLYSLNPFAIGVKYLKPKTKPSATVTMESEEATATTTTLGQAESRGEQLTHSVMLGSPLYSSDTMVSGLSQGEEPAYSVTLGSNVILQSNEPVNVQYETCDDDVAAMQQGYTVILESADLEQHTSMQQATFSAEDRPVAMQHGIFSGEDPAVAMHQGTISTEDPAVAMQQGTISAGDPAVAMQQGPNSSEDPAVATQPETGLVDMEKVDIASE